MGKAAPQTGAKGLTKQTLREAARFGPSPEGVRLPSSPGGSGA